MNSQITICKYHAVPAEAMEIRQTVFVEEQGFCDEFDDTDGVATHFVLFLREIPVATCRVFRGTGDKDYLLGRLAVVKEYRGYGFGMRMLAEAECFVRSVGGNSLWLHSQSQAAPFYQKAGFVAHGQPDEEQGCPHIWMKKEWKGSES